MSSMTFDVKYIIGIKATQTELRFTPHSLFPKLSNANGAVQKTKTAASTISTATTTPNANSWPVTLEK